MSDEVDGHRSDCLDAESAWDRICGAWNILYQDLRDLMRPIDSFGREASVLDELNKGDIKAFFALLKAPVSMILERSSNMNAFY